MRSFKIIFLFVVICKAGFSQALSIQWQKCLGGTLGDAGSSIKQTPDGGFLTAGMASSNDGDVSGNHLPNHFDYWIVKLDSNGFLQWQKCYGGSAEEYLESIELTDDTGFIAVGASGSDDGDVIGAHPNGDYWIIKCDNSGTMQWEKCLGGSDEDWAYKIIRGFNQNYLIFGEARSNDFDVVGKHDSSICPTCGDAWLVKIDTSGTVLWSKCYGGFRHEVGYSLAQTSDTGFILASSARSDDGDVSGNHGSFQGNSNDDYWIVKIDSIGTIQWQKCYGGDLDEYPYDIHQTFDGGYIIIGTATSNNGDLSGHYGAIDSPDAWIIKINSAGFIQWQKSFGGSDDDIGKRIIQLADSSYLALCYTASTDGELSNNPASDVDIWLVKLSQSGQIEWQQLLGGTWGDAGYDIEQTSDGGFIVTGLTDSNDGDVSGNHGDFDVWVVKLGPVPNGINEHSNAITDFTCYFQERNNTISVNFYANGNERLQVQLLDITGRIIFEQPFTAVQGFNKQQFHTCQVSEGVYLVRLINNLGAITKKLIVTSEQ